jgi:hypothetical protein
VLTIISTKVPASVLALAMTAKTLTQAFAPNTFFPLHFLWAHPISIQIMPMFTQSKQAYDFKPLQFS